MEPQKGQKSPQQYQEWAQQIVSFIKLIEKFKNSYLILNPQIIEIYKHKELKTDQQPTLWQTMIYAVMKFNEKPFDCPLQILEIISLLIFSPYFTPEAIEQLKNNNYQSKTQKNTKKSSMQLLFIRHSDGKIDEQVLKLLNLKKIPRFRSWIDDYTTQIEKLQGKAIEKEQVKALIGEIKKMKSIFALEFLVFLNWFLSSISRFKFKSYTDPKMLTSMMIKNYQFSQQNLTGLSYKILRNLNRKLGIDQGGQMRSFDIIKTKHLYNYIILSFTSMKAPLQDCLNPGCFHEVHKSADREKRHFLVDFFKSKCFSCDAERFASSSIHKIRMYQCFNRKFHNAASNHEDKKQSSIAQNQVVGKLKSFQLEKTAFELEEDKFLY